MEQQYFTPDIQDIKVGYELQYHNWGMDELGKLELNYDRWDTVILNEGNVKIFMEYGIRGGVRVPYLTKEQIEDEGWVFYCETGDSYVYQKVGGEGHYNCMLYHQFNKHKIEINHGPDLLYYKGLCKDINTFRLIIKLLNI